MLKNPAVFPPKPPSPKATGLHADRETEFCPGLRSGRRPKLSPGCSVPCVFHVALNCPGMAVKSSIWQRGGSRQLCKSRRPEQLMVSEPWTGTQRNVFHTCHHCLGNPLGPPAPLCGSALSTRKAWIWGKSQCLDHFHRRP